jgi:hypothetical protein
MKSQPQALYIFAVRVHGGVELFAFSKTIPYSKVVHNELLSFTSPQGAIIDTNGAQEQCS